MTEFRGNFRGLSGGIHIDLPRNSIREISCLDLLEPARRLPEDEMNCTSLSGRFGPKEIKMRRKMRHSTAWIEYLESREMFSGTVHALDMDSFATHAPAVFAPKDNAAVVKSPDIVGTFHGRETDSNEELPGVIIAVIKTQNALGRITGHIESTFPGQATRTTNFTGTITGDAFIMNTATTTVTGTVSDGGRVLTGSYTFNSSNDSSVGHFVVTRATHK